MGSDGLLDTNIFLHAQTHDDLSQECRQFLTTLERGEVRARLEPMVLHELSYAIRHYAKQMTRAQIADFLLAVLSWPGVEGDKDLMVETVERWEKTPGLGFVDADLAALAVQQGRPVYTKNVDELVAQGADVPDPLPAGRA